jgi:TRAP-type C4-dicarboxylate transport system substrate-binding protein
VIKFKVLVIFLVAVCVLVTAGCSSNSEEAAETKKADPIVMKMVGSSSEDAVNSMTFRDMEKHINEEMSEYIKPEVYLGGTLANDAQVHEFVRDNVVTYGSTTITVIRQATNDPRWEVMEFPMILPAGDWDALEKFSMGPSMSKLINEYEAMYPNIDVVGSWCLGWLDLESKSKIEKVSDLEGMKIRVNATDISMNLWKNLTANPTSVPFGDIYTSLQQGMIDAILLPRYLMPHNGYSEVCNYHMIMGVVPSIHYYHYSRAFHESLPDEVQTWMMEEIAEGIKVSRQRSFEKNELSLQQAIDAGCEIVEPTEELWNSFKEASQKTIDDFIAKGFDKSFYEECVAEIASYK